VRTRLAVDAVEGLAEVGGQGVGSGDGVVASLDFDGAVAAGGADELPDRPTRLVLDPTADSQRGEDDCQVSLTWVCLPTIPPPKPDSCRICAGEVRSRVCP